jgi:hypothetical protein
VTGVGRFHLMQSQRWGLAGIVVVVASALAVLALSPAGAPGAVTATLDFETGPPIGQAIENDYISSAFVFWRREDTGFRPYRRIAGVPTASGTVAADIGPDHCSEETTPSNCEFPIPGTLARLTSPAGSVTLYAGLFSAIGESVTATLTGYNSAGNPVATSTATIGVGITTPITVSSGVGDITSFGLVGGGPGAPGAPLGFDDLTIQFVDQPPECPTETPPLSPTERVVSSPAELNDVLRSDFTGRVIVPPDVSWEMKDCDGTLLRDMPIDSGVSLIGQRGDLGSRPLLYTNDKPQVNNQSIFVVTGNDVRVEGVHLRGHRPASKHTVRDNPFYLHAITVVENFDEQLGRRVVISDNEFDQWTGGGVNVIGSHDAQTPDQWQPGWARPDRSDAYLVRVVGNYMHHNAQDGGGYGVVVGCCAYTYVVGNVFETNRHAVAASGKAYSGYIARFNYVLEGGVKQDSYYNQHFDVHGTKNDGYGGYAGEYFLISDNTVRGEQKYGVIATRPVLMLRGRPGNPRDHRPGVVNGLYFNDNFLVHKNLDAAVALKWTSSWTENFGEEHKKFNFHAKGNHFNVDRTTEIASGDFDGDGRTDVFLANGTGWFYSRGGVAPWEFLDASGKRTRELGFADVDNDRITDVIYRRPNGKLIYLKRGASPAVSLPFSPLPVKDLRFGDFDGDGLTDIFYTRNRKWHIWYGATHSWSNVGSSVTPISEMLFGEFDEVPGTDIAAVRNNQWSYSRGATERWARLNGKRRDSFEDAVAADFDGNGRTDIAFGNGRKWRYSRDGRGPIVTLRDGNLFPVYPPLRQLLVGHFDGGTRATVLSWNMVPRGTPPVFRPDLRLVMWRGLGTSQAFGKRSSQNMR